MPSGPSSGNSSSGDQRTSQPSSPWTSVRERSIATSPNRSDSTETSRGTEIAATGPSSGWSGSYGGSVGTGVADGSTVADGFGVGAGDGDEHRQVQRSRLGGQADRLRGADRRGDAIGPRHVRERGVQLGERLERHALSLAGVERRVHRLVVGGCPRGHERIGDGRGVVRPGGRERRRLGRRIGRRGGAAGGDQHQDQDGRGPSMTPSQRHRASVTRRKPSAAR